MRASLAGANLTVQLLKLPDIEYGHRNMKFGIKG
jgi:hypothetical protein